MFKRQHSVLWEEGGRAHRADVRRRREANQVSKWTNESRFRRTVLPLSLSLTLPYCLADFSCSWIAATRIDSMAPSPSMPATQVPAECGCHTCHSDRLLLVFTHTNRAGYAMPRLPLVSGVQNDVYIYIHSLHIHTNTYIYTGICVWLEYNSELAVRLAWATFAIFPSPLPPLMTASQTNGLRWAPIELLSRHTNKHRGRKW